VPILAHLNRALAREVAIVAAMLTTGPQLTNQNFVHRAVKVVNALNGSPITRSPYHNAIIRTKGNKLTQCKAWLVTALTR